MRGNGCVCRRSMGRVSWYEFTVFARCPVFAPPHQPIRAASCRPRKNWAPTPRVAVARCPVFACRPRKIHRHTRTTCGTHIRIHCRKSIIWCVAATVCIGARTLFKKVLMVSTGTDKPAPNDLGLLISILHSAEPLAWRNIGRTLRHLRPKWSSLAVDTWRRSDNASAADVRRAVYALSLIHI